MLLSDSDCPLITIGVTAFNAEKTIEAAIRSATNQLWPNIEIVVVDDCSSDKTPEILNDLVKQNVNMRVYRSEQNKGVAVTRNRIIQEAKGEFIAFFDDDDESAPERLTRQYGRILEYEREFAQGQPVICHTARLQRYPDGSERYAPTMGITLGRLAPHGPQVAERILLGRPIKDGFGAMATCSQMARKTVYLYQGLFDERFRRCEDTDFNIRLAMSGGHFPGTADALVTQTMTLRSDKNLSEERFYVLQFYSKHKSLMKNENLFGFCQDWINIKFDLLEGHNWQFIIKLIGLMVRRPFTTLKRLWWTFPNMRHNLQFSKLHNFRE
jgi:glycosyltransferase involved in cell wall biosynthesis